MEKLLAIQSELKAPKTQLNKFGGYNYRNCEDILEAVKPLLKKHNCTLVINDEVVMLGNRFYVKATAVIVDGKDRREVSAFAREAEVKKGMDEAQITGSASSYARKYALNGLFLIDDTKDADSHNDHGKGEEHKPVEHRTEAPRPHVEAPKAPPAAPKAPAVKKALFGKVDKKLQRPNSPFVTYTLEGQEEEVSTKDPAIMEAMKLAKEVGEPVIVAFNEVVNGRFTNRYITEVKTKEDADLADGKEDDSALPF